MRGPEVRHPTEEVEDAVPHGDQGRLAEQDGLTPVGWLGELGEDNACHAGLYEDPWQHRAGYSSILFQGGIWYSFNSHRKEFRGSRILWGDDSLEDNIQAAMPVTL